MGRDVLERKRRVWDTLEMLMWRIWEVITRGSRRETSKWQGKVWPASRALWYLKNMGQGRCPTGCRFFSVLKTFSCNHAILPPLAWEGRVLVFIFLLFQMCFSSQSMLKYNVYHLYFLFYVRHKFSVVFYGVFSQILQKVSSYCFCQIKIILKPPQRVFVL